MPCRSSEASHSRSTYSQVSSSVPPQHQRTHRRWDNRLEDDVQAVLGLDEAYIFDNIIVVEVLEEVDLGLCCGISSAVRTDCFSEEDLGGGWVLTSIMRSSLLGRSASLICLTATASPVPQLNAL